jgi:hypothetical protein
MRRNMTFMTGRRLASTSPSSTLDFFLAIAASFLRDLLGLGGGRRTHLLADCPPLGGTAGGRESHDHH